MIGEKKAKPPGPPIIAGCHRSSFGSGVSRENRPKDEEIEIAGVIGKIDSLSGIGSASEPASLNASEEADAGGKEFGDHVASSCLAKRIVRRTQVRNVPRLMTIRKMNSMREGKPSNFSTKAS